MNTLNFFITRRLPDRRPARQQVRAGASEPRVPRRRRRPAGRVHRGSATSCSRPLAGLERRRHRAERDREHARRRPARRPAGDRRRRSTRSSAPGTYAAIDTGVIGTDAIRVGLIYKPAKVTPVGAFKMLTRPSTRASSTRGAGPRSRRRSRRTRPAPASRSPSTTSSRRARPARTSATPTPATGRATATAPARSAAQALVDWLATDPTGSGDPDFLIIGDLNSYAMEDPIDAIKAGPDDTPGTGDDYTNLVAQYLGPFAYSYTFDGQAGYLDHALAQREPHRRRSPASPSGTSTPTRPTSSTTTRRSSRRRRRRCTSRRRTGRPTTTRSSSGSG